MTAVTIELPNDVYERLATTAQQQHKPIEVLVRELITEGSVPPPAPPSDRERMRAALRAAGLLVEPSPEARQKQPLTPDERAALADRLAVAGVKPLSEIIIEEREGR